MDTSRPGLCLGNAIEHSKTMLSKLNPDGIEIILHKVMSMGQSIVVNQFIRSDESLERFRNG